MKWGGNKTSIFAACQKCNARPEILYARERPESEHASFMVRDDGGDVVGIYGVNLQRGRAMSDSGCRRAAGGTRAHMDLQEELDARDIPYTCAACEEYFVFSLGNHTRL